MPKSRLIPLPKDAPPGTLPTIRELIERVYEIENSTGSGQSNLLAGQKGLGATVQNLSATVSDLSSRYSVVDQGDNTINTGAVPNDSVFHDYGTPMSITIDSPGTHRQFVVSFGAGQVRNTSVGASATLLAEITFEIPGVVGYGVYVARVTATRDMIFGVPVNQVQAFRLNKGTYTINAKCRVWCSNTSGTTCEVIFIQPFVMAQIMGAD